MRKLCLVAAVIASMMSMGTDPKRPEGTDPKRPEGTDPKRPVGTVPKEEKPLSVWAMPSVWPQHVRLRRDLIAAIQRGDRNAMESICRTAISIIPADATWHYNLACALAYRDDPAPALDELDKAITFGFRNVEAIEKDRDLVRVKGHPRFPSLVEKARALAGKPVPNRPATSARTVAAGGTVTLADTNFVWNLDTGVYAALLKFAPPKTLVSSMASSFSKSRPTAKEIPFVVPWLSEGTAAGNYGDIYLNRDNNHSAVNIADFPQLTAIRYPKAAQKAGLDTDHPNAVFAYPVFGNISRGFTKGPYWRSIARHSFTAPGIPERMDRLYRSNQFWVMPAVKDFGNPSIGDVFPANAPFQLVSQGISWSDLPFVRAALAASASFHRSTKSAICRRRLMGPTMQWLIRSTLRGVANESDYLSRKAHPTAFAAARLDVPRLVQKAHDLHPEQVPPAVSLAMINSTLFPIRFPIPVRDFPDVAPEVLFATPSAVAIVLRAPAAERTFLFRAQAFPEVDSSAVFAWKVVNGDPSLVKIASPVGETLASPENGYAQITIDRHSLTGRVDVACFARTGDRTSFGAPSIISFYALPGERRTYRPDGKIESIDYSNPEYRYCDPRIALPRKWRDEYSYTPSGVPTGFTRYRGGRAVASFTPHGDMIVERNPDGSPKTLSHVKYIPRGTGDDFQPLELVCVEDGAPFPAP